MSTSFTRRKAIMWDIQKQHAAKMYYIPNQSGASTAFTGYRAWLKNTGTIRTRPSTYAIGTETTPHYWKDGHAKRLPGGGTDERTGQSVVLAPR